MEITVNKKLDLRVVRISYEDGDFSEVIACKNIGQALKKFDDIYGDQVEIEDIVEITEEELDEIKITRMDYILASGRTTKVSGLKLLKEKASNTELPFVVYSIGD